MPCRAGLRRLRAAVCGLSLRLACCTRCARSAPCGRRRTANPWRARRHARTRTGWSPTSRCRGVCGPSGASRHSRWSRGRDQPTRPAAGTCEGLRRMRHAASWATTRPAPPTSSPSGASATACPPIHPQGHKRVWAAADTRDPCERQEGCRSPDLSSLFHSFWRTLSRGDSLCECAARPGPTYSIKEPSTL